MFKLFCYILGRNGAPFPVNITQGETVGDLNNAILNHKLVKADAIQLKLWKVCVFQVLKKQY